ncbi:hypothetical protein BSLG_000793 [Batrachochytrium salamandrivorans]|nr:hypothetical protein BSLG_000793 [Batrachochytrium salamandrivorans]
MATLQACFASVIYAAVALLQLVHAGATTIILPMNLPSCWYNPAFQRPMINGQLDVDLLAGAFDWAVSTRDSPTTATDTTPSSCYYSSGKGMSTWRVNGPSITHYWNCLGVGCSLPCNGNTTVPFPSTSNMMKDCSGDMYQVPPSGSSIAPYSGSTDPYSRFLVKDFFDPVNDNACQATPIYRRLVRVYDKCTMITSDNARPPRQLFAISQVSPTEVVQRLCLDSACSNCTTSTAVPSWKMSSLKCQKEGTDLVRGMYLFSKDGDSSNGNPGGGSAAPGSGNGIDPTSRGGALNTNSSNSSAPHVLLGLSVGASILFVSVIVLGGIYLMRRQNQGRPSESPYQYKLYKSQKAVAPDTTKVSPPTTDRSQTTLLSKFPVIRMSTIKHATAQAVSRIIPQPKETKDRSKSKNGSHRALSSLEQSRYDALCADKPINKPRVVMIDYKRQRQDELDLTIGDQVVLMSIWTDGWGQAYNLTTGEEGIMAALAIGGEFQSGSADEC